MAKVEVFRKEVKIQSHIIKYYGRVVKVLFEEMFMWITKDPFYVSLKGYTKG